MKYLLAIMILLVLSVPALGGTYMVTEAQYVIVSGNVSDTLGREMITPDSIRIVVTDSAGTELFDAWFEAADAQCALNGDVIAFFDQWEDINGAADIGIFSLAVTIASDADNNIDLFSPQSHVIIGVTNTVEATFNEIGWILDSLQSQDDWVGTTAKQTLVIDTTNAIIDSLQSQDGWVATAANLTLAIDSVNAILDTLQNHDDWVATATALANAIDSINAVLDSIQAGFASRSAIGDTNQVDGISTFDSTTDSTMQDVSIAELGLIPVTVDSVLDERNTGADHNVVSSVGRQLRTAQKAIVLLTGTINTANDSTATLGLSGDYPDGFFDHTWLTVEVGTDSVQIRQINNYTGATDSIDMAAGEAWVIVPANGDEWEITAATGTHVVDLHTPVVLQIVAAMYDKGIWIDDGSGNTNTVAGVDGTRANPVSTFAAARTLADALEYQKYYLVNNTSLTLAATHEDWEFIGIGESNEINFGDQDIDNSNFEHLMVAGVQGGTGLIWLNECYLDAADSLECVARNSWFSDTVSVRVASNIIFDNCYSAVAGNNTPAIDFNSAAGTINLNIRHYSGGMAFLNGTTNHTVSIETDGQLVVDASCTSLNVTARGNMTITDNGTTSSITKDAVFSRQEADEWVWANADTTHPDSSEVGVWLVNNLSGGAGAGADSTEVYGAVVQVLEDSTSKYQGAASGLDAAEIADTLTNRGVTTGNGQYYDTLIVLNTIDSTAIANMGFDILPLDGGTPLARVTTDGNGSAVARLEAESLSVRLIFQGYTFNTKDTLVIVGSQTDTLWGTGVVLPAPPADMVTIVMGLITANFDTLNPSYVWWRPVKSTNKEYKKSDELYYGTGVNALAIQKQWTIETSSTGTFSFSVFANANLSDTLSQYEFWFYWADGRITQKITAVPDQASFNPIGQ